MVTSSQTQRVDVEALLIEVADVLNTTLDLDTLLQRVAEVVKRVIDYEIFSILLLNERAQELRFRFQIGHLPEVVERIRVKVGEGVTGRAVKERRTVLVDDVSKETHYIEAVPRVRSELAVPLITKQKIIATSRSIPRLAPSSASRSSTRTTCSACLILSTRGVATSMKTMCV